MVTQDLLKAFNFGLGGFDFGAGGVIGHRLATSGEGYGPDPLIV